MVKTCLPVVTNHAGVARPAKAYAIAAPLFCHDDFVSIPKT